MRTMILVLAAALAAVTAGRVTRQGIRKDGCHSDVKAICE